MYDLMYLIRMTLFSFSPSAGEPRVFQPERAGQKQESRVAGCDRSTTAVACILKTLSRYQSCLSRLSRDSS